MASGVASHSWSGFSIPQESEVNKGDMISPSRGNTPASDQFQGGENLQTVDVKSNSWNVLSYRDDGGRWELIHRDFLENWEGKHPNFHRLDRDEPLLTAGNKKKRGIKSGEELWWSSTFALNLLHLSGRELARTVDLGASFHTSRFKTSNLRRPISLSCGFWLVASLYVLAGHALCTCTVHRQPANTFAQTGEKESHFPEESGIVC